MKSYSSRELLQLLFQEGWYLSHQSGSHIQLKHSTRPGKITVPHPRKDLARKTLNSIIKQSGLILDKE